MQAGVCFGREPLLGLNDVVAYVVADVNDVVAAEP